MGYSDILVTTIIFRSRIDSPYKYERTTTHSTLVPFLIAYAGWKSNLATLAEI